MTKLQLLGLIMLVVPFPGTLSVLIWRNEGFRILLWVWAITLMVIAWVIVSINLMTGNIP